MAKKDFSKQHSFFTDNTILQKNIQKDIQKQEIDVVEQNELPVVNRDVPVGFKPAYVEVKSKRVQLVFQPSIYEKAKARATKQGISLNEYIHRLINADIQ